MCIWSSDAISEIAHFLQKKKEKKTLKNAETKHWREVCIHPSQSETERGKSLHLRVCFVRSHGLRCNFMLFTRDLIRRDGQHLPWWQRCWINGALFRLHKMLGVLVRVCAAVYTHLHLPTVTDKLTQYTSVVFSLAAIWGLRFSVSNRPGSKWYAATLNQIPVSSKSQRVYVAHETPCCTTLLDSWRLSTDQYPNWWNAS